MSTIHYKPDNRTATVPVSASTAIERNDLVYYDTGTETVKSASSQADAGTLVLNQRTFAMNFAGMSLDKRLTSQTAAGEIEVMNDGVVYLPCTSDDYDIFDLVGIAETAGGDALDPQKVAKVTDPALAIGVVVRNTGASSTYVWVYFKSKRAYGSIEPLGAGRPATSNVETLAGTKTLVQGDAQVQVLDPGGAGRNVVLPSEALSANLVFIIHNSADAAEILTVKASNGSTTVVTPTQNETAYVFCDGTTWRGFVGANN